MKILLIYPPSDDYYISPEKTINTGAYSPPLGLLYIASALEKNDHEVAIFDCNVNNMSNEKIKREIRSFDAVGMTLYTSPESRYHSVNIAKTIKDIDPDMPLIFGGPHCSILPDLPFQEHHADICVRGYGEITIPQVMDALEGKRKLSAIPGIYYKESNEIKKTNRPKEIENLDNLAFPARHLVEKNEYGYVLGTKICKGKTTSFITSRGCPFHCKFCGLNAHVPRYKVRSVSNVIAELDIIIDKGYETIFFVDDNFLFDKKRIEKIMDHIIKSKADLKIWITDARADSADRILYEKMKIAGVESISFGIENGNQDVLDYYDKKLKISKIKETVNLSKEMGFFINASFILGAPIETKQHIENTIKFAKSLPIDAACFFLLYYPIGSKLREEAIKEGKIKENEIYVFSGSKRGFGNLSTLELKNLALRAEKSFYRNPHLWMRYLHYAFSKKDFRFIRLGLKSSILKK